MTPWHLLTLTRGFKICRVLAITHPESCIAIHTVNPEVPAPRFGTLTWLKYFVAKLTFAITRRSSFGFMPEDLNLMSGLSLQTYGLTPPLTPGGYSQTTNERPQTSAYALCDSPSGLLAHILDAIRPPASSSRSPSNSPESLRAPSAAVSPGSPQSYGMSPQTSRSSNSPEKAQNLGLGTYRLYTNFTCFISRGDKCGLS